MSTVNKINVNGQTISIGGSGTSVPENITANDVAYDSSTQYDDNTVGKKISIIEKNSENNIIEKENISSSEENVLFNTETDETVVKITSEGLYSKKFFYMNGNEISSNESSVKINIASSDKIAFFSNSFLNGYCVKGHHTLDNISMYTDYIIYNFGKSGDRVNDNIDRLVKNQTWYGKIPIKNWRIRYGVIAMMTNDGTLFSYNPQTYYHNVKHLCTLIESLGAEPILSTEHNSSKIYYGLQRLVNERGYKIINFAEQAELLFNTRFAPFWFSGHPSTRTSWMWSYGMKSCIDSLPRPMKSIKLFRVRNFIDTTDIKNLMYEDLYQRSEIYKEINRGVAVLSDEKYVDRMDKTPLCSFSGTMDEYQNIQSKTSVLFGNYALIEIIIPYTSQTIKNFEMNIDVSGVTNLYIKKYKTSLDVSGKIAFGIQSGISNINVGDIFSVSGCFNSDMDKTYTVALVDTNKNIIVTTEDSTNHTISGTDSPTCSISGVVIKGSYKYPSAEYINNYEKPFGSWEEVEYNYTNNKLIFNNSIDDCLIYDKLSFLLKGNNLSIKDIEANVSGDIIKNDNEKIVDNRDGVLISSNIDTWNGYNILENYTPVKSSYSNVYESLPKNVSIVKVMNINDAIDTVISTNKKDILIEITARYFPLYIDSDSKYENTEINEDSYDCSKMLVIIDNVEIRELHIGAWWNVHKISTPLFNYTNSSHTIKIICKNKNIHIADIKIKEL